MPRFFTRTSSRDRRHRRVRARVVGTATRPRLSVFRSVQHIVVQLIDDAAGKTLVAASDRDVEVRPEGKVGVAREVGKVLASRAKERGITTVVFDRGGYAYHGRVQAVADGAREGGLVF